MPLLPHVDYYYDLTGTYAYVLLNGPDEHRQKVIEFLQSHDIRINGHGKSNYPARSGRQYDWYVRVATDRGAKPEIKAIHSLLREFQTDDHSAIEQRQDQARELQRMLQAQKQKTDEFQSRLRSREQELERIRRENADLAARQAQTKDDADGAQRQVQEKAQEVSRLEEDLAEAKEFINSFSADFDAQAEEYRILEQQHVSKCAEVDQLKQELSEAREALNSEGAEDVPGKQATSNERMMQDMLTAFYPEVELLRDSVDTLLTIHDNKDALLRIRQIVMKSDIPGRKKVQAAGDWWEVYYSTGQDESGRLYYRPADGSGYKYKILVSLKEKQSKDTQYLKKQ